MSASDIQRRVDTWIDTRSTFPRDDETPSALWDACSGSFGATSAPALGCLLALVREAWGMPGIHTFMEGDRWWVAEDNEVMLGDAKTIYGGDTEDEALVAALEAAP